MIELSAEDFAEAHRLMSVGGLVQGLIHNLNGPLQNLGMDMDMIGYSLEGGGGSARELQEEIRTRIARMEKEFEHINRLIRIAASRVIPDEEEAFLALGDFLDQEITFLHTNLYFKHRVERGLQLEEGLPALRAFPDTVPEGLRSLLKAVVEDMERREMTSFSLEASAGESGILLELSAGKGSLSRSLVEGLRQAPSKEAPRRVTAERMTAVHAGLMLARAGLRPEAEEETEGTRIRLVLGLPL